MTDKRRFPLELARLVAENLFLELGPLTQRMMVAGSIRRERADVGDIELVYVPRIEHPAVDLWGNPAGEPVDLLDGKVKALVGAGMVDYRQNASGSTMYGAKNKFLVHQATGIPIDLFATAEINWGMTVFVRTGPADWNKRAFTRFHELGMQGHAYGGVSKGAAHIACPTEEDVFRLLEWDWADPKDRR